MIVVVASGRDPCARMLADRWHAALLTPADLSVAGWRYDTRAPQSGTAVADGRMLPARAISGVLTRLPAISEQDLEHVDPQDRTYVACEMGAFLLAWLSALHCPVLNRPTPECLSGPAWRRERWIATAARLAIPVEPICRASSACRPYTDDDSPPPGVPVTVIGDQCFGSVEPGVAHDARRLARAAAVDLLELRFTGPDRGSRFIDASVCPDLSAPAVADAVFERFQEAAPC